MYVFRAVDGVLAIGHGGGSLGVKDMHLHADDIHFAAAAEHVGGLMDVGHDTSMVVDAGLGIVVEVEPGLLRQRLLCEKEGLVDVIAWHDEAIACALAEDASGDEFAVVEIADALVHDVPAVDHAIVAAADFVDAFLHGSLEVACCAGQQRLDGSGGCRLVVLFDAVKVGPLVGGHDVIEQPVGDADAAGPHQRVTVLALASTLAPLHDLVSARAAPLRFAGRVIVAVPERFGVVLRLGETRLSPHGFEIMPVERHGGAVEVGAEVFFIAVVAHLAAQLVVVEGVGTEVEVAGRLLHMQLRALLHARQGDEGIGPAVTVDVGVDLVLYTVVPQRPIEVTHHVAHIVGCMVRNGDLCVEGCWKNT